MYVIGTAGHVDHGKSTLVKALSGIDPDRLREEKERQMTIDLGFAWLTLPSGKEVGIVDVPGHRDFIDNMLAGAGGIDAVLFIIAADEGVMPQSREHLSILNLLDIKQGIIVLTKSDLVEDLEWLELIKADIRKFSANTFLADSPIIEISSITGKGLENLLVLMDDMLDKCESKPDNQRPRLPIDRVFSLKGFGTIVTGTLLDGQFSVGQQVEVLPQKLQTRIRGIQFHKKKVEVAGPGSRTALNLTGIDNSEIFRGNVVAKAGIYSASRRIDVRFSMLKDTKTNLVHNDLVKLYCGTSQTLARVRIIGNDIIMPDEKGWLQLETMEPVCVAKGDHFILRRPSPGETLGGGEVLDENPVKRIKRFSKQSLDHFHLMETGSFKEIIHAHLSANRPITFQELSEKTGFSIEKIKDEYSKSSNLDLEILALQNDKFLPNTFITTHTNWQKLSDSFIDLISGYHKNFPLRQGILKDELRRALDLQPRLFGSCIELLAAKNLVVEHGDMISLPDHTREFGVEHKKTVIEIMAKFESTPYSPPSLSDLKSDFDPEIILALINRNDLILTSDDIAFRKQDFELMLTEMSDYIKLNGGIALNQFRDMFQTSRKYALSFLEYLDKQGITVRDGDKRILRTIDKR